jgi:hypothetical protein
MSFEEPSDEFLVGAIAVDGSRVPECASELDSPQKHIKSASVRQDLSSMVIEAHGPVISVKHRLAAYPNPGHLTSMSEKGVVAIVEIYGGSRGSRPASGGISRICTCRDEDKTAPSTPLGGGFPSFGI